MAYEIHISRGVADIDSTKSQRTYRIDRDDGVPSYTALPKPFQTTDVPETGLGCEVTQYNDEPVDENKWGPVVLGSHSVAPGMTPEGHAQPNAGQALPGAKSRGENFSTEPGGQKSGTRSSLVSISEHRFDESLVPSQLWEKPNDDQSPQDGSRSSLSSTFKVPNVKFLNLPVQVFTVPTACFPPPNLSDSSTKWTGDKVYRHTTNSEVTFVDGNLDAPRQSGEYRTSLIEVPKGTEIALSKPSSLSTSPPISSRLRTSNMLQHDAKFDESDATVLFLDPFQGSPLELERQASDISDLSGYIRPQAFSRHRDTLARITWTRNETKIDEDEGFHSDEDEQSQTVSADEEIDHEEQSMKGSDASYLPAEILHQIFFLLQPCDFEAARHACRSWFIASLDQRLTRMMMRRAGCYLAHLSDLKQASHIELNAKTQVQQEKGSTSSRASHDREQLRIDRQWLASKRLATESRLSAAWHGSSIRSNNEHTSSRLSVRQTVDFTHLLSQDALQKTTKNNTFTVSTCGKFVLVTSDRDIYVYGIGSQITAFQPLVRLVAETKVIAVSMDTSANRFAVAALLEGRMGACWEIDDVVISSMVGGLHDSVTDDSQHGKEATASSIDGLQCSATSTSRRDEISICAEGVDIDLPQSIQFQPLDTTPDWAASSHTGFTSKQHGDSKSCHKTLNEMVLPVRVKANAVYRNLGTKNDAPRSVAICPQRKCAAFGCRSGIELHWVDALTGADLNRWFPLAAPSDCLYFLPQRAGIDSAKKLRLISSAINPAMPAKHSCNDLPLSPLHGCVPSGRFRARSMTKLFQGQRRSSIQPTDPSGSSHRVSGNMDCDHYGAMPLSDGQHMLFTDPTTGLLCLGSDAPLGGPTKLVRKACMIPPRSYGADQLDCPVYYTAASDLSRGVRIIAAYDDGRLVLYNIPSDCFERLRHVRSSPEVWDDWNSSAGQSDLMMDAFMSNRETAIANAGHENGGIFKSLQIDGALLGYVDADVETIAIDTAFGGFKVWVFHASGQATQMDIYVPRAHQIPSRFVGFNGLVHEKSFSPLPRAILKTHTNTPSDDKVKEQEDYFGSHVRFVGLDGCCDHRSSSMCGPMVHKADVDFTELSRDEGISMTPGVSDDEDDERPLQVELLTDWRAESLLRPYIVNVTWIDAH